MSSVIEDASLVAVEEHLLPSNEPAENARSFQDMANNEAAHSEEMHSLNEENIAITQGGMGISVGWNQAEEDSDPEMRGSTSPEIEGAVQNLEVDMLADSGVEIPTGSNVETTYPEGENARQPLGVDMDRPMTPHGTPDEGMNVQQLRTISRLLAFDRKNDLHNTLLVDLHDTVCSHDIDGIGICFEDTCAILPGQAIRMQWVPKPAFLPSRSVLYGEHARGREYLGLMVARLEQFGQHIMILWKKGHDMEDEGIQNTMSLDVAIAAYESAVKTAARSLMDNKELESVHSFAANLGYVPESGALFTESQKFDGFAGVVVLHTVWQEFKRVIEETLPAVRMMLYVEHYGDKAELDCFSRTLDQWFDLKKCKWCTLSVATVLRMAEGRYQNCSVFCTRNLHSMLRPGGGSLKFHYVAAHPHLANATWQRTKADAILANEDEAWHGINEGGMIPLQKLVVYCEFSHMAWSLRERRNPFHSHKFSAALALPVVVEEKFLGGEGHTISTYLNDIGQLKDHLIAQYAHLETGRCGMRLEGTYCIHPEELLGTGGFQHVVRRLASAQEGWWRIIASSYGTIAYESQCIWKRCGVLAANYLNLLAELAVVRKNVPRVGLTMGQVTTGCIADSLLELLYYGRCDSATRALLRFTGLMHLFENTIPMVSEDLLSSDRAYDAGNAADVLLLVRNILANSMDILLQEKVRKRGMCMVDWRSQLESVFASSCRISTRVEEKVVEFFCNTGLDVLCGDMARKMSHSLRNEIPEGITSRDIMDILKLQETADVEGLLQGRGMVVVENVHRVGVEEGTCNAENVAKVLVSAAFQSKGMYPSYFLFPVLLQAAEIGRQRYDQQYPQQIKGTLAPYLARAIRRKEWRVFPKLSCTGARMYARRLVRIAASVSSENDAAGTPRRVVARPSGSTSTELIATASQYIAQVRGRSLTPDEHAKLSFLAQRLFSTVGRYTPATDGHRFAFLLCALKNTIDFTKGEWRKVYKFYGERLHVRDVEIIPFWKQEFRIDGRVWLLFRLVNRGQEVLVPELPWPYESV
jgi:hypothetical protein